MDRIIDLDQAAAAIAERLPHWHALGLAAQPLTWRDETASWPRPLLTERASAHDPDSVGLVLTGPNDTELHVVLFRGGWADIDFRADADGGDFGSLPTPHLSSVAEFPAHLDRCVRRVWPSAVV
ncbi:MULTISPECIES: hypothetical protein [Streptomyces]|uniref:hypothetical protein n=1 Tax=Streptomyces TaxID=1883 RepID=UPI00163C69C7|nr:MULTISPECIES: hypothetical protein [Streptomyces]MBC2875855.1 hypothetical protein [Streptomyces sp. TYQ1024]UBI37703.1 hypothetical protein K7I03_15295 [Streptomyces mobaraensis]UKW30289.1 hypothetical protein MCU78_15255 [Streptomyces sp. TYQ1024]